MAFELPPLPYAHDALAPVMGQETLEYHHDKHHNTYVVNLNNLIKGTDMESQDLEAIVRATYNKPDQAGIFNNASQHWNHNYFWRWMKPNGGGAMPGELEAKINSDLGGVDAFKEAFVQAGATQFGSGWCWLVMNGDGKLEVTKTPNGVNPLCFAGQTALLGCDVWEHSYYLDFRNRRPDYIKAFLNDLVDWEYVASLMPN
ncbi:MAG: superoxide dismutase [Alphaproteobacteria bacterium]|nr:superoxide dismutase [Alphaproteobacteria bacterium]